MEKLGSKTAALQLAKRAGRPSVPGALEHMWPDIGGSAHCRGKRLRSVVKAVAASVEKGCSCFAAQ